MTTKQLEVYSEACNSGIVRMPGRRFPGVVIQGDSLSGLFDHAMTVVEHLSNSTDKEAFEWALYLAESLEGHLINYEQTLKKHKIELPFLRDPNRNTKKYRISDNA